MSPDHRADTGTGRSTTVPVRTRRAIVVAIMALTAPVVIVATSDTEAAAPSPAATATAEQPPVDDGEHRSAEAMSLRSDRDLPDLRDTSRPRSSSPPQRRIAGPLPPETAPQQPADDTEPSDATSPEMATAAAPAGEPEPQPAHEHEHEHEHPHEPEPEPAASPADTHTHDDVFQTGGASWYGDYFQGRPTASGEPYDQWQMTAAHRDLPLGTVVEVVDVDTRRAVTVRINDRGPFASGSNGARPHPTRVIDLSRAAAEQLGFVSAGHTEVEVRIVA